MREDCSIAKAPHHTRSRGWGEMPGNLAPSRLPPAYPTGHTQGQVREFRTPRRCRLWGTVQQSDSLVAPELMALNSLVTEWATKKSP